MCVCACTYECMGRQRKRKREGGREEWKEWEDGRKERKKEEREGGRKKQRKGEYVENLEHKWHLHICGYLLMATSVA